ncbi:hypothetical protein AMTR_s00051p00187860, partial [Amborella trichopoda]
MVIGASTEPLRNIQGLPHPPLRARWIGPKRRHSVSGEKLAFAARNCSAEDAHSFMRNPFLR